MAPEKWTAADLPDQTGRTIVITGASGGLGLVAARELARAGTRVVLAVRDVDKGRRVAATTRSGPTATPSWPSSSSPWNCSAAWPRPAAAWRP